MALPNLTNQNIQDTYQRVIQTDGTKVYNGTGSLLPIEFNENNVIISGTLTAQSYIVSESIISVSSGSTAFGNSSDDTHTFIGAITSSGDLLFTKESTANITANENLTINIENTNDLNSTIFKIHNLTQDADIFQFLEEGIIYIGKAGGDASLASHGEMTFMLDLDNNETDQSFKFKNYTTVLAELHESEGFNVQTHITASGNISSSGELIGIIDGGTF